MRPVSELFPALAIPARILITMHQKPDADALGSSLGLKGVLEKMGHQVSVISPTNWPAFLSWMPGCAQVVDFEAKRAVAEEIIQQAGIIFCLDFNDLSRTKGMAGLLKEAGGTKVLIDHHQEPQTEVFDFGISDTGKGSTAEMVYDFVVALGQRELID